MNRLFVVDKPIFRSSNGYLGEIKRRYRVKKAGFSGTLDPFATGCLIVATGQYTRLFPYLAKTPKTYRATLWLGAESESLDLENIHRIRNVPKLDEERLRETLASLQGELRYTPPKYSAKQIGGRRAYDLARSGQEVELPTVRSTIHSIRLLHYRHPFATFEATVSEGTYLRSVAAVVARRLGVPGTLSALRRLQEGAFRFENERPLDPLDYLAPTPNRYFGDPAWLMRGRKLRAEYFETAADGLYVVELEEHFSILEFRQGAVRYRLNLMPKYRIESARP